MSASGDFFAYEYPEAFNSTYEEYIIDLTHVMTYFNKCPTKYILEIGNTKLRINKII